MLANFGTVGRRSTPGVASGAPADLVGPSKCVQHCFGYEPPHSHTSGASSWKPEALMSTDACPSGVEAAPPYGRTGLEVLLRRTLSFDFQLFALQKYVPNLVYHLPFLSENSGGANPSEDSQVLLGCLEP